MVKDFIILWKSSLNKDSAIFLGVDIKEVQEIVETHLKNMLLKHFDPKKADSIFSDEGAVRD